jgi:hypothetical protein
MCVTRCRRRCRWWWAGRARLARRAQLEAPGAWCWTEPSELLERLAAASWQGGGEAVSARAVVIGSGFGGLAAAVRLRRAATR